MDLPLISALCNDRSLIKQTETFDQIPINSELIKLRNKNTSVNRGTLYLNNTQKTSIIHRHPNDKLPPIPTQTAKDNNYVMDPTPTPVKHKSFNSQPNL